MIKGRLVLKGTIELTSPTLIGSGNKESADIDVVLGADGRPFIPATSFMGVLKDFIYSLGQDKNKLDEFWGFEDIQRQSNIICSDLYSAEGNTPKVSLRDGIKIDSEKGIVKKGAKYDYQVVEKEAKFDLNLEAGYKENDKAFCLKMFALIKSALEDERIRIGAKTNSGLGKIKLGDAKFYEFDFSKREDVLRWLKKDFSTPIPLSKESITDETFTINATFRLKNSFIIRDYSSDMADSESIKSGNDFVITGTSIKGAIRKRAERILKTLGKPEDILTNLFGNVDEDKKIKIRGRIRVDEVTLPKYTSELQPRIKIDRFTGGTIESALFNSMPVFNQFIDTDENGHIKNFRISIKNYQSCEAGLILLVLKDLWTGDLAVGGEKSVGRGVFEGIEADICWGNKAVKLKKDDLSRLSELKHFVEALAGAKEAENAAS